MRFNYKFACIALCILAFAITLSAILSVSKPIGADYYWHLNIANMIADGNLGGAVSYLLSPVGNNFPYGFYISFFHFMLVPTVWSGNPYLYGLILESLFLPLTFALTVWLVAKKASWTAAFITGVCLLGTGAFLDGALQVRPESLDLLLYPLVVYCVLSFKPKSFLGMVVFTVYSHGVAALSNFYAFALKKALEEKRWRVYIKVGVLAIAPVLILTVGYLSGAFTKWFTLAGANQSNPQQTLFWTQPLWFIPIYGGSSLLGVFFLFKRNKSPLESLLLWGLLGSLIMVPFWADRWMHYISIPLSCLVGCGLAKYSTSDDNSPFVMVIGFMLFAALLYTAYWFNISLIHGWAS